MSMKDNGSYNGQGPEATASRVVRAMGLVFGDIGTSPIYTLTIVFALLPPTRENVVGVLSLVFWTMMILVTAEYAWLAMKLDREGQGGAIMLREIIVRLIKPGRMAAVVSLLTFIGVSLLLGDGVITPAISIISAVEGILLIPGLEILSQEIIMAIAIAITLALFFFQRKGADRISGAFGPFMLVWFLTLFVSGFFSLLTEPSLVKVVNPYYALDFMLRQGLLGFIVLSDVVLCATGGEALYADMGHLGKLPIKRAWWFVFIALFINYLGQGAFALQNPDARTYLFGMVKSQVPFLYIPFLLLTIGATVIASQAMISGVFSIVYQGVTTRLMPLLKVSYTSSHLKSQIYIGSVNWVLMAAVILIILVFRKSENLGAAYGLAVTGSMTVTGIMLALVFGLQRRLTLFAVSLGVVLVDLVYFSSTLTKIPHGAYWSLILAAVPFAVIAIWTQGQKLLFSSLRPLDLETFLVSYEQVYAKGRVIEGTAIFFARSWKVIPPYVSHCMFSSNIIYEKNIFICINRTDYPFGIKTNYIKGIGTGLDALEIEAGYLARIDFDLIFKMYEITPKIIFYGVEDIITTNPVWRVFSFIKKVTPNFVQFNKLPASKVHGVVTRVEM
ncbi:MAG: KUP/HAK/KT family potassium transporter [Syntrophales bacterium]|nr:KUP/HAK/KT family potassium transporter [Syntrophales bacterium]